MKTKTLLGVVFISLLFVSYTFGEDRLKVATTLSTYADIAKTIGGEFVEVTNVASPRFNPHFIEPRPSDVLKVKRADIFIHSGLDLEAWRDPLVDAVARSDMRAGGERQLDLSQSIHLLEVPQGKISRSEGDIHIYGNPHYWIDPRNGLVIAQEIEAKLTELDPAHGATYKGNLEKFRERLTQKISGWRLKVKDFKGEELLGYHNEWIYLMDFMGFQMKEFIEPKPGIPPTPKHLQYLTQYIRDKKIRGIVQATFYPKSASEDLAKETGTTVLLLCQNVGEIQETQDYITMLDYNISKIVEVFKHG